MITTPRYHCRDYATGRECLVFAQSREEARDKAKRRIGGEPVCRYVGNVGVAVPGETGHPSKDWMLAGSGGRR